MTDRRQPTRTAWKVATLAAVAAVGFFTGWSATGVTGGVFMGVVLTAGTAVPVWRERPGACAPRRHRTGSS